MFTKLSEHFEFRHFRPHYMDVDTIFGDLRRECLGIVAHCRSFFQTKLVSFGRWVVLSSLVWKKNQNRTLRFVNKSLKMYLKNGIKLNGTSF